MTVAGSGDVTDLIARARLGESAAANRLFPLLYEELRALARSFFVGQRPGETLQPTALVHEAWIRLSGPNGPAVRDRQHLMALAARSMRQVLVDHARARHRIKRDGEFERITIAGPIGGEGLAAIDLLALDEAMRRLAEFDSSKAQLVELRFFAGLSGEEAAKVLGVSPSTVDRDWRFARAWLAHELRGQQGP
ncbi:MAG: sigma-70 family RNA polymerase sigma factor [Planctomycetota bacterium]|nr:sigma-70 family RNA polymerase sigma factor [Planctomycetota bacterium]